MNTGSRKKKNSDNFFLKATKVLIFAVLSYAAVRVGMVGGNYLYGMDTRIVEKLDASLFKSTLNSSLPLIDMVYNSGNISMSFSNDVRELINGIFGFDLNEPLTVLNAQSSYFYSYYINGYPQYIADLERKNKLENHINDYIVPDKPDEQAEQKMPENASSIFYEEETHQDDVTPNDIVSSGKISILNETKLKIDIDKLLKEPLKLTFNRKGPKILIYHTHTTESYLRKLSDLNKKNVSNRTQDPRYNVVRVGEELAQIFRKKYGIEVIHNGTIHDYPNYNYSYSNSLNTITKILKSYPSIQMTLDIHRDALGVDGKKLRAVTKINNKNVAQIMFVVGTDQGKLSHPNWRENLKLALKLQEELNAKYPNLAKPIDLSKNRYNEHVTLGSLIVEIGGDGNTLDECLESTKYLAEVINEVIK
ncbi:MAG: stage II sporulation protein P [Clostridiales bacterium]|nr:stage II sporulation protein P [Eubacteriales bacterium]MDH7565501.1 stage II sporulation protein P [Clostridiales bacterium]